MIRVVILSALSYLLSAAAMAQSYPAARIQNLIESYQKDPRGPYKDIRWFCDDGSIIAPKESCPDGGVQRARYKEEVERLAETEHLFLGQILATTSRNAFWDAANNHSRLKQYQLEHYLQKVDDGWVNRKAQYYRGAYQIEDEMEWGQDFFRWLLNYETALSQNFFLIRQAARDLPHGQDTDRSQRIRALSKVMAEAYPQFMDLRIKLHGQPDSSDLAAVQAFDKKHHHELPADQQKNMQQLIEDLSDYYAPVDATQLDKLIKKIPAGRDLRQQLEDYITSLGQFNQQQIGVPTFLQRTADALLNIRQSITEINSRTARMAMIDLSLALEDIYLRELSQWTPNDLKSYAQKIYTNGIVAAGTGLLERWEWEALGPQLKNTPDDTDVAAQKDYLNQARRLVEWGAGMHRAVYQEEVDRFQSFEPKAYGFIDDRIRSSVLLDLGQTVGTFGESLQKEKSKSNHLLGLSNASHARGLNAGVAKGELVIIETATEDMPVDKTKIYVFRRPPSDLKPVAGIATVTEGNMVSHVQLLARNLSIPNAVISDQNFEDLKAFAGKEVFYVVAPEGRVLLKTVAGMSDAEQALFEEKQRTRERVEVAVDRIRLDEQQVLDMRKVDASDSGVRCGPKAANLGQLKKMYPDQVVEGLVIPFGIFRAHMDQTMPGQQLSYWTFLNNAFAKAAKMRIDGMTEDKIETYVLEQLELLREGIQSMQFSDEFRSDLLQQFEQVFKRPIGEVPVFVRSDTNMEDLKEFTGAGLNLTLFNVVTPESIFEGIKKVWASPYTERSFKWRQRYLINPENVFPSILIIPSVDVDFSGVIITKGITNDVAEDLTVAISRGAGGAVDGQAAESYLLEAGGQQQLLTPAREPGYRRLPVSGGTSQHMATFDQPIASATNLQTIRDFADRVEQTFPEATGTEPAAAYDIEFGFANDKLWLFQIRPFVESKNVWEIAGAETLPYQTEATTDKSGNSWWLSLLVIVLLGGAIIWWALSRNKRQILE